MVSTCIVILCFLVVDGHALTELFYIQQESAERICDHHDTIQTLLQKYRNLEVRNEALSSALVANNDTIQQQTLTIQNLESSIVQKQETLLACGANKTQLQAENAMYKEVTRQLEDILLQRNDTIRQLQECYDTAVKPGT